jgi:soluble lytic murein transglycosylase-like protein
MALGAVSAYNSLIQNAAAQYNLSPTLLTAVIQAESGGNPNAVSSAGAQGLMQLMPTTAASLGVTNPFDPAQNINAGARYLSSLISQYGDVGTALAAYNWGPGNVTSGAAWPVGVQNYVSNVLAQSGTGTSVAADGSALVDLSGAAAATSTPDIMSQLGVTASQAGIDLTDPTTEIVIALAIGAAAYLAFA